MADDEILSVCAGRADALALIKGVWTMFEVWDDAIDGDAKEADEVIHSTFCWMLFELPKLPIWVDHPGLSSALRVCISNWKAANALERSGDFEKTVTAYTLRCAPYDFFVAVALAAAGPGVADQAAVLFRGAESSDHIHDYLVEHLGGNHGLAEQSQA